MSAKSRTLKKIRNATIRILVNLQTLDDLGVRTGKAKSHLRSLRSEVSRIDLGVKDANNDN